MALLAPSSQHTQRLAHKQFVKCVDFMKNLVMLLVAYVWFCLVTTKCINITDDFLGGHGTSRKLVRVQDFSFKQEKVTRGLDQNYSIFRKRYSYCIVTLFRFKLCLT